MGPALDAFAPLGVQKSKPSIVQTTISSESKLNTAALYSGSKPLSKNYLVVAQDFHEKASYRSKNDHLVLEKEEKRKATYNPIGTRGIDKLKVEFEAVRSENENMEGMIDEIRRRNEEAEVLRRKEQEEKDYVAWERDHAREQRDY